MSKFLTFSTRARRRAAELTQPITSPHATSSGLLMEPDHQPLRARSECATRCYGLLDILRETERNVPDLLAPCAVHVYTQAPDSLWPKAQQLIAENIESNHPFVLALPAESELSIYRAEREILAAHGVIVLRLNTGEIGRFWNRSR